MALSVGSPRTSNTSAFEAKSEVLGPCSNDVDDPCWNATAAARFRALRKYIHKNARSVPKQLNASRIDTDRRAIYFRQAA
jgi:hypothetical protein